MWAIVAFLLVTLLWFSRREALTLSSSKLLSFLMMLLLIPRVGFKATSDIFLVIIRESPSVEMRTSSSLCLSAPDSTRKIIKHQLFGTLLVHVSMVYSGMKVGLQCFLIYLCRGDMAPAFFKINKAGDLLFLDKKEADLFPVMTLVSCW